MEIEFRKGFFGDSIEYFWEPVERHLFDDGDPFLCSSLDLWFSIPSSVDRIWLSDEAGEESYAVDWIQVDPLWSVVSDACGTVRLVAEGEGFQANISGSVARALKELKWDHVSCSYEPPERGEKE